MEAVEVAEGSQQASSDNVVIDGASQPLVESSPAVSEPPAGMCICLEFFLCTTALFCTFGTVVPERNVADSSSGVNFKNGKTLAELQVKLLQSSPTTPDEAAARRSHNCLLFKTSGAIQSLPQKSVLAVGASGQVSNKDVGIGEASQASQEVSSAVGAPPASVFLFVSTVFSVC